MACMMFQVMRWRPQVETVNKGSSHSETLRNNLVLSPVSGAGEFSSKVLLEVSREISVCLTQLDLFWLHLLIAATPAANRQQRLPHVQCLDSSSTDQESTQPHPPLVSSHVALNNNSRAWFSGHQCFPKVEIYCVHCVLTGTAVGLVI